MAWGPQPYKGNIFVSDMRTGLWVMNLASGEGHSVGDRESLLVSRRREGHGPAHG